MHFITLKICTRCRVVYSTPSPSPSVNKGPQFLKCFMRLLTTCFSSPKISELNFYIEYFSSHSCLRVGSFFGTPFIFPESSFQDQFKNNRFKTMAMGGT